MVPLRLLSEKKYERRCFLELVPLRGEKKFKPHPQNMVLEPVRASCRAGATPDQAVQV